MGRCNPCHRFRPCLWKKLCLLKHFRDIRSSLSAKKFSLQRPCRLITKKNPLRVGRNGRGLIWAARAGPSCYLPGSEPVMISRHLVCRLRCLHTPSPPADQGRRTRRRLSFPPWMKSLIAIHVTLVSPMKDPTKIPNKYRAM